MSRTRVCAGQENFTLTPKQEKLFGGKSLEPIGSGTHACVYASGKTVVKFTGHESDAAAALAVAKKPVSGVLPITNVERVGDYYFAIKSQRVQPPGQIARIAQRCATSGGLHLAFIKRAQAKQKAPADVAGARSCVYANAPRIGVEPKKVMKFLGELSQTQARLEKATGVIWYDVGAQGNFTQDSKGKPVIVDFGASTVPRKYYDALKKRRPIR